MKENIKVLWLASWYPNKILPFNGDFIKRHAEAVSLYADVHVLHIMPDEKGEITRNVIVEETITGRLKETIVYYHSSKTGIALLNKLFSELTFRRTGKRMARRMLKEVIPDIVHVHVGLKSGLIARWIKRRYKIPYIVTEHWTGLLQESKNNFSALPVFRRKQWKKVIEDAAICTAVSNHLAQALTMRFNISSVIIPNVVNTKLFYPGSFTHRNSLRFIFISTFDDFKNPDLVLRAFREVTLKNHEAKLVVFAPAKESVLRKCKELGIENNVHCSDEIPQKELAGFIRESDALVLYSSYETFGCVVIEANACGIPVIASDIPAMRELIKNKVNGLLVEAGSFQKLADAMMTFSSVKNVFDQKEIAASAAARFNYSSVGEQFFKLYKELIKSL